MVALLSQRYWWPQLEETCITFVAQCFTCQLERATFSRTAGWRGQAIPPPPGPRLEWSVDLLTDLPSSSSFRHILACVDVFSKFVILAPLTDKSATTVVNAFRDRVISAFGVPLSIRSDNGSEF